jgi:hypothetical protein
MKIAAPRQSLCRPTPTSISEATFSIAFKGSEGKAAAPSVSVGTLSGD